MAIDTVLSQLVEFPAVLILIEVTIHAGHGDVGSFEGEGGVLMLVDIKCRRGKSLFGMALCTVGDGFGHGVDDFTPMGIFMAIKATAVR